MGTAEAILTLNAGSSSLKFAVFGARLECRLVGQVEGLGTAPTVSVKDGAGARPPFTLPDLASACDHAGALAAVLGGLDRLMPEARIGAVGHRVVHGGADFAAPVAVDGAALTALDALVPFAPLHQPHNLAGIRAAMAAFPALPQIACFDTAFHRAHPFIHDTFALPRAYYDEGVRRYGFHGLSYEFLLRRLGEIAPDRAAGRVILCHLGNGASICAVKDGQALATTMGFSPLDGLAMGTRPGQLDPAVVLYLMEQKGMNAAAIADLLYRQSGLKGLSGISNDMRVLEASPEPGARAAIDYFVARLVKEIAGMAGLLGGVDTIVFSGGIGENAPGIRRAALAGMKWMGVVLDEDRNRVTAPIISAAGSRVLVPVIPTNEEWMIAHHTRSVMQSRSR